MKAFVTGGAGFIGSHLTERLARDKHKVVVYDNFSSGKREYLKNVDHKNLRIIEGDVLYLKKLCQAMTGSDIVFHMSANADVRKGVDNTRLDLEQETIATYNILESMRKAGIKKIVFPSSMTVYGKVLNERVAEDYGPCLPISLYAAAKLSCEALISAFCNTFKMQSWIIRFANVVGSRANHGVIYDLVNKLIADSYSLHVLGDGEQNKPYIYITDAIAGIFFVLKNTNDRVNLFNLGTSDTIRVREIVEIILNIMKINDAKIKYEETSYGWKGDVPEFSLDITKIKKIGFSPKFTSRQAVEKAVKDIVNEAH